MKMDKLRTVNDILNTDGKEQRNEYSEICKLRFKYEQPSMLTINPDANFIKTPFQEDCDGLMIGVSLPWNDDDRIAFW